MGKLEEVRPPQPHTNIAAFIPFRFRVLIFVVRFSPPFVFFLANGGKGTGTGNGERGEDQKKLL